MFRVRYRESKQSADAIVSPHTYALPEKKQ